MPVNAKANSTGVSSLECACESCLSSLGLVVLEKEFKVWRG